MANANRSTHPAGTAKSEVLVLTGKITGGGAATDCTNPESGNTGAGEITSATYVSTGTYAVTFRHLYPSLLCAPVSVNVGTTDGLRVSFSAIDITAGTATMEVWVGSTLTALATTDTLHLMWVVRNSGRNA